MNRAQTIKYLRIIAAGASPLDMSMMLRGLQAFELASAVGVQTAGMTTSAQAISAVYNQFDAAAELYDVCPPEWPSKHPECPLIMPTGLRWEEMPVTISHDSRKATTEAKELLTDDIVMAVANEWVGTPQVPISSLHLEWKKFSSRKPKDVGLIHITHAPMEPNTLGFVLQPRTGESMGAGGSLSGDMYIANNRDWDPNSLLLTMLHEFGHSFGLNHSDNESDIMHGYVTRAGVRTLQGGDIAMIRLPYPIAVK